MITRNDQSEKQTSVTLKGQQYIPNDPICKYGKMVVTLVIDGKERMFCGFVTKKGVVEEWFKIPTPDEVAPGLFAYVRENVL